LTRLIYAPGARDDMHRERDYYARIQPSLGARFVTSVERAVRALAEQPLAMQELVDGVRRWPVRGFEHGVLYAVEPERIVILAVFHPRQRPRPVNAP